MPVSGVLPISGLESVFLTQRERGFAPRWLNYFFGVAAGGEMGVAGGALLAIAGLMPYLASTGAKSGWLRSYSTSFLRKSLIIGLLTLWYSLASCAACGRIVARSLLVDFHCRSR